MNTSDSAISRHTLPKPKRRWVWLVVLAAVGLAVLGILYFWAQVRWRDAEQFLSDHRSSLRMDSTRLILAASRDHTLSPDVLPASLRPPGVQYAEIEPDRITLVLYTSPDTTSGFRVWLDKPAEGFQDAPTSISFVTRFRYCNDYPKSPRNRP